MKKKIWTCDFEGCDEIAQWYRKQKGELLRLCTKHEAYLARKHWGKRLDTSELGEDDMRYLEEKEFKKESEKKRPFEVILFPLEDGTTKVKIRNRQTGERRSFVVKGTDEKRRLHETYNELEREGFSQKPSIDDYVKRLRNTKKHRTVIS